MSEEKKTRLWDVYNQTQHNAAAQEQQEIDRARRREVRPWDLLNPQIPRSPDNVAAERLAICKACPRYRKRAGQCKECGCIMPQKVKLAGASCPLGKWGIFDVPADAVAD